MPGQSEQESQAIFNRRYLHRVAELRLCEADKRVAQCLIAGLQPREIVRATGFPLQEVRIRTIVIDYRLGQLPPDDAAGQCMSVGPRPSPRKPGSELPAPL